MPKTNTISSIFIKKTLQPKMLDVMRLASMSRIKQVLQLSENGVSNRQIAKDLDINKETVNNYVRFFWQNMESKVKLSLQKYLILLSMFYKILLIECNSDHGRKN